MKKIRLFSPALAGLLFVSANAPAQFATPYVAEDFSTDPAQDGWQIFGDTNLFVWDPVNQDLEVTWDSSQPNSYYFHSLGTILGRDDDFQFSFDLNLSDAAAGVNPDKPDAMEVAVGFLNFAAATDPGFVRAFTAVNLAEFDYFPSFVDPVYGPFDASISPVIVSANFTNYYGAFGSFFTFTNGVSCHVRTVYTAASGVLVTTVTPSGSTNIIFTDTTSPPVPDGDDFRLDTFAIASYTDTGDDYDSLLAHGTVDNLIVTLPPPPVQNITVVSNAVGTVQFGSRSNWLYTLQRTGDLQSWSPASAAVPGNGG